MTTNDCVMMYMRCVWELRDRGKRIGLVQDLLESIPFQDFSLAVFLNRKLDQSDDALTLNQIEKELLDSHMDVGADGRARIAGYSPEESDAVSSFYMKCFFVYQHSMRYENERVKQDFRRRMFAYPYYYYQKYDPVEPEENAAGDAIGSWDKYFQNILDCKDAPWNLPEEPGFMMVNEYDQKLRNACSGYRERYHIPLSDVQYDWLDIIVEGFNTVLEDKWCERRKLQV